MWRGFRPAGSYNAIGWVESTAEPCGAWVVWGAGVVHGRRDMVHTLLTLGTPHQSLEKYPFGRIEVWRQLGMGTHMLLCMRLA